MRKTRSDNGSGLFFCCKLHKIATIYTL
jgi:hypothetical protein